MTMNWLECHLMVDLSTPLSEITTTSRGTFAGGFFSFKPYIPKSLLLSGEHTIQSHFTLINYQVCMY